MIVAYAVVRDDPPQVFLADDVETLQWVIALQLVARSRPESLGSSVTVIREALVEERWADAVSEWMGATSTLIDVYPSIKVHGPTDVAMGPAELQFTPLFEGAEPPAAED